MDKLFVNVGLNLPIDSLFTYSVPEHLRDGIKPGLRVLVEFGKKEMTGIVTEVHDNYVRSKAKKILSLLDEECFFTDELLTFCKWISEYYVAPPGEVLFSAVPGKFNIKSEIRYCLSSDFEEKVNNGEFKEDIFFDIIELFKKQKNSKLTKSGIEKRLKFKDLGKYIFLLKEAGIILPETTFTEAIPEKRVKFIKSNFDDDETDAKIKEHAIKSGPQISVLKFLSGKEEIELKYLLKSLKISTSPVNSLLKKDLIKIFEKRVIRESEEIYSEEVKEFLLTEAQKTCLERITSSINDEEFKTFLLHGVTGSGKTEIYINSIREVLKKGKSALVLVPEISLTPQLIHRFRKNFEERIGIIHSKIPDGERLDTLHGIISGEIKIVIGARSALFAPLKNIGLIIVDEEHDSSYKQESSPRYNGRDSAVYRAMLNSAAVILGSATPSFESYQNAVNGKFELLSLPERATSINMPEIKIIDLLKKQAEDEEIFDFFKSMDRKVRVKFLSKELIFEIGKRLEQKENVIILQNRRGYHAYLECQKCGKVETCRRCSITLTYHKAFDLMKCHYCGFTRKYNGICSSCGSTFLIPMGAGTERVEEELSKIFPRAVIVRMDSDVLSSRKQFQQILKDFYDKKIDILTGTQIISKGLDFPEVTLVGVVNADIGLLNPDFRATEKVFQILTQVSGRSGRSQKKGEVMIQTNHSDYFVFDKIRNHDYEGFFRDEIKFREKLNYPPFSRLAIIESRSTDKNLSESKIKEIYNLIKKIDTKSILEVLPPNVPLFSKLKDKFRFHLLIKSKKKTDPSGSYLTSILREVKNYANRHIPGKVSIAIDVDAVNLL